MTGEHTIVLTDAPDPEDTRVIHVGPGASAGRAQMFPTPSIRRSEAFVDMKVLIAAQKVVDFFLGRRDLVVC